MIRNLFAAALMVLGTTAAFADDVKSGPQPGSKVPGPFSPLNINGESAGQKQCLFCKNGDNPVVMIFARTAECPTTCKLIKAVDAATAKNSSCDMGSFVVFLSDDDKCEAKLKDMAEKENLKKIVLSVDNPSGPKKYEISKDADLTVVLYTGRQVKANYAFRKGEMKDSDVDQVIKDISKILPETK